MDQTDCCLLQNLVNLLPCQYNVQKKDVFLDDDKSIIAVQYFLDYPYLVYPAFDYPSIGSDNNL